MSSAPLYSQERDRRLHGGYNGIQYHTAASTAATANAPGVSTPVAASQSNGNAGHGDGRLDTPRPMDFDAEDGAPSSAS